MKTVKLFALSALLLAGAFAAEAQDFATGYFLGGYQYAYRMNPAFPSEHDFFSVGLGQFGANIQSDFGFSDFVMKNAANQYVLFLNNEISTDDFMSGFNDGLNKFQLNTNVNLISKGKWNKEKYAMTTFDVAVKSTTRMDLPYDMFYFLKDWTATRNTFDFSGAGLTSRNYLELAYGITKIVKNKFNFGIRLKGLVGLANASMRMETLKVDMSSSNWQIDAKGTLSGSVPFVEWTPDSDNNYSFTKDSFKLGASKLTQNLGLGGAADVGLSINLFPWFTVSGAVLDFGVVNWVDEISGSASSVSTFDSTKATDEDQFTQFLKSMQGIYKFKAEQAPANAKTLGGNWEKLPFRINAGAELRIPFLQRLSVGALYTMYVGVDGNNNFDFSGIGFNSNELLLSVNFTPLNFLSVSASSKLGNFAKSFGAAVNLHPGLFNLFAGVDVVPLNLINIGGLMNVSESIKPYMMVPADDLNLNAYVGLSFALGKRQIDYRKMSKQIIKEQKEKDELKAKEKKEKEEMKAKEKELKEYEKLQAEEAKAAEQKAKEDAKAAKIAEKEAAAQAKADEKAAKEQAAAEAKAAKDAAAKAKADAKAAKEAEKAAKAQEKAAKAAEKAAAKNAEVEAAAAKMEAEKAAKAAAAEAEAAKAQEAAKTEATAAEQLLENALENKAQEPAAEEPKAEAPAAEPAAEPASQPAAPTVFEFPNL